MRNERKPGIEVRNAQRSVRVLTAQLQSFGETACLLAWKYKRPRSPIRSLRTISITIVADRQMAKLHRQFCGISGTTDVLTFDHGEIVISAQTAVRHARDFHSTPQQELHLYLLHGLLHLCGFDDRSPRARTVMHKLQDKLVRAARTQEKEWARAQRRLNE